MKKLTFSVEKVIPFQGRRWYMLRKCYTIFMFIFMFMFMTGFLIDARMHICTYTCRKMTLYTTISICIWSERPSFSWPSSCWRGPWWTPFSSPGACTLSNWIIYRNMYCILSLLCSSLNKKSLQFKKKKICKICILSDICCFVLVSFRDWVQVLLMRLNTSSL